MRSLLLLPVFAVLLGLTTGCFWHHHHDHDDDWHREHYHHYDDDWR